MRSRTRDTNQTMAVLVAGAGFRSRQSFADAVNRRGWQMYQAQLTYDHVSVKRWLAGGTCQHPEVVAAVLGDAWGVPIPVAVIWPHLRDGDAPLAAHDQAWVAERTLEDLGVFLRSDMLTRRDTLTAAVQAATGAALLDPITRWLAALPAGPPTTENGRGPGQIGMATVGEIERGTWHFRSVDAAAGGGLAREAAVGQLKYAVDLAQHASYGEAVGTRLLTAIADLAGQVGWMCHDAGMEGPAQRYLLYGLQAAHESDTERGRLKAAATLADLGLQMESAGRPDTAVRLVDLALEKLPDDRRRFNAARAVLWTRKAQVVTGMGGSSLPEVRHAVALSFDLYHQSGDDEHSPAVADYYQYACEAELASGAAACYRELAPEHPSLAALAEEHALRALAQWGDGFNRSRVFDQINLARIRFRAGEPEQASLDGQRALDTGATVSGSTRVNAQLRRLLADSKPYLQQPAVAELRDRIIGTDQEA